MYIGDITGTQTMATTKGNLLQITPYKQKYELSHVTFAT